MPLCHPPTIVDKESVITYQRRLARTLYTIQAQEERWWALASALILRTMFLQSLKYEGNTVLRLVIDDLRHDSGLDHISYGHATCGKTRL